MTAFDNIKTNNWPATSNEFEDFLVLKLPLNDQASLTESLSVGVSSQELFPKRTLTNFGGVSALESGDEVYARVRATMTNEKNDSTDSLDNLFDGNLSTTCASTNGTDGTITFSPAITGITSLRIHCQGKPGNGYFVVNGTEDYGQSLGDNVYQWVTINNVTSLSTIFIRHITGNTKTTVQAIEVNGTVLVDPAGGLKKHYDNNATFSSSKLIIPQNKDLQFEDGDFTIEAYINPDNVSGTKAIVSTWNPGANRRSYTLNLSNASVLGATHPDGGSGGHPSVMGGTVTAKAWSHVAFVRDGSTLRLFVNGTQVGTTTASTVYSNTTDNVEIGAYPGSTSNYFAGKIQDVRIYKGAAKYTSNFTPPSAILD